MRITPFRSVAFACALLHTGPVGADTLDEILAPVPGAAACWQRTYSDRHLAGHPRQKVTKISFSLSYYEMDHHEAGGGDYSFSIDIVTRERSGSVLGQCFASHEGRIICGGDCDTGAVSLRRSGTEGSILVELESGGLSLSDCGSEIQFRMSAEPDDKLFLVHPAACVVDASDVDPAGQ